MGKTCISTIVFLLSLSLLALQAASDDLQSKCSTELSNVAVCIDYATAKADAPSGDCCKSVSGIRDRNAVCLCYIIQQASKGGPQVDKFGLKLDRLIQLPTACKLADASAQNCPKLLNLSPSSPDNAIFTNATKATTAAATTTTTPSTGSATADTKSGGVMWKLHLGHIFTVVMVSAIFLTYL